MLNKMWIKETLFRQKSGKLPSKIWLKSTTR